MSATTVHVLTMLGANAPKTRLEIIAEQLQYACQSKVLFLENLQITDSELIEHIVPFLKEHTDVHNVNLIGNQLSDVGIKALTAINTIDSLNLGKNNIGPIGVACLVSSPSIRTLNLYGNPIGSDGIKAIALALSAEGPNRTLSTLTFLNKSPDIDARLSFNAIYPSHVRQEIETVFRPKTGIDTPRYPGIPGVMGILYAYLGVQQLHRVKPLSKRNDPNPAAEAPSKKRIQMNTMFL